MTIITVPSAALKAASLFYPQTKSAASYRYYLYGVYVDPAGFLVATDGSILFAHKIDISDVEPFDGWIVPPNAIKQALSRYKEETITISPDHVGDVDCYPVDGFYPDWRRAVPYDASGEPGQFDPGQITRLGKAAKTLSAKTEGSPFYHIHHNGQDPAGVSFYGQPDALGAIMPLRVGLVGSWEPFCGKFLRD